MKQQRIRLKTDWKTILGSKRLAQEINQINRILAGTQFIRGGDTILTSDGIMMRVKPGSSSTILPLTIKRAGDLAISIHPGTVQANYGGAVDTTYPTLGGTAIDQTPAPTLTVAANDTTYIYVKALLTAGPAASLIKFQYEATDPMTIVGETSVQIDTGNSYDDVAGTAYKLLGWVTTDASQIIDGGITQTWLGGNLAYIWTNAGHHWGSQ